MVSCGARAAADANQSWQHTLRLAKKLSLPVQVRFEWHDKEAAAHPGKRARVAWEPAES